MSEGLDGLVGAFSAKAGQFTDECIAQPGRLGILPNDPWGEDSLRLLGENLLAKESAVSLEDAAMFLGEAMVRSGRGKWAVMETMDRRGLQIRLQLYIECNDGNGWFPYGVVCSVLRNRDPNLLHFWLSNA